MGGDPVLLPHKLFPAFPPSRRGPWIPYLMRVPLLLAHPRALTACHGHADQPEGTLRPSP
eukprot:763895-Hanusia_phi.AAC.2